MTGLIDRVGHVAERLLHPTTHDVLDAAMDQRMVIVDVETTGLDVRRDDLLAIGAVSIQAGRLQLGDAFSVLMDADPTPSPHNLLVHRLTPRLLRGGAPPREALDAFLDFAGHAPLLAYHAPFDAAVLRRAVLKAEHRLIRPVWLDVAEWALMLAPELGPHMPSLDDALNHFDIPLSDRHDALADATATAWLALKLLSLTEAEEPLTLRELRRRLRRHRVLRRWRS